MQAFLPPAALPRPCTRPRTCPRKPSIRASADGDATAWEPTNFNTLGSGVPSSGLQTIEFIIRQDGSVEETVTGVRGKHCDKLTEKIEKALGRVLHTEKTAEYFQEVTEEVLEKTVNKEGVDWPGAEGLPTW